MALTPTEIKRITFLSLLSSAANLAAGYDSDAAYGTATDWLNQMQDDGFFEEARPTPAPSTGRSAPSRRQASSTPSQTRGRDQQSGTFSGNYRDPDGPPTDKQVGAVLAMTADYTEDELYGMTKAEVGDLISDLKKKN
jgi:hypothetical protein